jgi:hypothetical protein
MVPSDRSGTRFVGRPTPDHPWWPVEFGALPDGREYLCSGGRIAFRP